MSQSSGGQVQERVPFGSRTAFLSRTPGPGATPREGGMAVHIPTVPVPCEVYPTHGSLPSTGENARPSSGRP